MMRCVITQFTVKDLENESIEVPVHVKLWRVNGCHELLASLGEWCVRERLRERKMVRCTARMGGEKSGIENFVPFLHANKVLMTFFSPQALILWRWAATR